MSYRVFFSFSTSLSQNLRVPKGTLAKITEQIRATEEMLGLTRTPTYTPKGEKQKPGWQWLDTEREMRKKLGPRPASEGHQWWLAQRDWDKTKEAMGWRVRGHNEFVRGLYDDIVRWSKDRLKGRGTETITVGQSAEFWGGLAIIEWPRELWSKEFFTDHMEHLFDLLTRGESRGRSLGCAPYNLRQADCLIRMLEDELDQWGYDLRFAVPLTARLQPYDFIRCSHDGGYDWCSRCGPIHEHDFHERCLVCPRAKEGKCDLKNSHPAEFEDVEKPNTKGKSK